MNLKDKVVLITGARRGLGAEMARHLAQQGVKLFLVDIEVDEAFEKLVAEINGHTTSTAYAHAANVANEDDVIAAVAKANEVMGPVQVLVNNAGITRDGLLVKVDRETGKVAKTMSVEQWDSVIDVNLKGTFLFGREVAKQLIDNNAKGVIINISSVSADGNVGQTNYAATKAGVSAMTTTWAKELARYGIRSAAIAPGFINTEMVAAMPEKVISNITGGVPLKRLGEPSEIAKTVEFIIDNDFVTGRTYRVDGGFNF